MTGTAGPEGEVVMSSAVPARRRATHVVICAGTRLPAMAAAAALVSCAAPSPLPQALVSRDTRTPLRVMADSTVRLASRAAEATDTATTHVRLVLADTVGTRTPATLAMVRAATLSATTNASAAIMHGDRLSAVLGAPEDRMAQEYGRYWNTGRRHLDVARTRASQATVATDSAIACGRAPCALLMAREAKIHADAAAGAAHEARSVVRIAASYVN